jgi:hypothetical protein
VLQLLTTFAAADEKSKLPFYVLGGALVAFALIVSALGISRHETFPPSKGALRGVLALAVLLVLGAMASAVITA